MSTKPFIYTEEFVTKELQELKKIVDNNPEMVVMGELFEKRPYSPQRFSEWEKKFEKHDKISESIKKLKSIFENRLNKGGLTNKLNPTMTIFNLKNNYGWRDRNEMDVTSDGKPIYGSKSTV